MMNRFGLQHMLEMRNVTHLSKIDLLLSVADLPTSTSTRGQSPTGSDLFLVAWHHRDQILAFD